MKYIACNKLRYITNMHGQTMLLVIVVMTAAALIMATSVLLSGLGELDMGYTYQCGEESFAAGDGCLEEALYQIYKSSGYSNGSLTLGNGSCIIGISGSATNKVIYATSTVGNCNKRFRANVAIGNGSTSISSWLEY